MPFIESLPESPPQKAYTQQYDYDGDGNMIYHGWAQSALNAADTARVWAIQKITYAAGNVVKTQWANGSTDEVNSWAARASLTYK